MVFQGKKHMTDLRKAAEMALEALEHFNQGNSPAVVQGEFDDEIESLRQALAQQDKECVAIVNEGMGGIEWLSPPLPDDTPLYTAPPKREWVGLTRLELDIATLGLEDLGDCYVAIEAKLKEKNGYE
jgi:hypothetical protein